MLIPGAAMAFKDLTTLLAALEDDAVSCEYYY
jgi:hypothetical protein